MMELLRRIGCVRLLNLFGLALTLIGVILLTWYGITPINRTGGQSSLLIGTTDTKAKATEDRYDAYANKGLWFIIAGTSLQILAIGVDAWKAPSSRT